MLKGETQKKTRTLLSPDYPPLLLHDDLRRRADSWHLQAAAVAHAAAVHSLSAEP